MAKALGMSWVADRFEVVEHLNKYRALLYHSYEKFKLFDDSFHCICVQNFVAECGEAYQGFTLPEDILGSEAVWSYGKPLTLRSRWRESHTGIGVKGYGRVEAVQMPETFATERDLQKISKIKIYSPSADDEGKKVYIEVLDASNKIQKLMFCLVGDGFAVNKVKVRKILSVSLPAELHGHLLLAQEDGYELSEYTPWETVPTYRRIKVKSQNCPSTVIVQGTKRFTEIYFDHDIVEVGSQLIIEAAGKFFKYGDTTTDQKEIQTAEYHRNKMEGYLKGEIARTRGNAIQDGSPFKGAAKLTAKKTLPGYQKR